MKPLNSRASMVVAITLGLLLCSCGGEAIDTTIDEAPNTSVPTETDNVSEVEPDALDNTAREQRFSDLQLRLMERYADLNEACRGGLGDRVSTWHACARREVLSPDLRRADLCYGTETDASAADMEWRLCREGANGYSEPPQDVAQGRCRVTAEGQVLLSGNCLVQLDESGDFWVMNQTQTVFAKVERVDDGDATGQISATGISADRGSLIQAGACWQSDATEICAWR